MMMLQQHHRATAAAAARPSTTTPLLQAARPQHQLISSSSRTPAAAAAAASHNGRRAFFSVLAAARRSRHTASDQEADDAAAAGGGVATATDSSPSPASSAVMSEEARRKAKVLKEAIFKINAKHGSNTVMQMTGGCADVERTSSGCLTLDRALGGGYPRGRIVEIFGPEASGKTTLALHAMAEVQKAGGTACFIDAEHAFDAAYAQRLGIDVDSLLVCQPDYGEQALNVMDELVRSGTVDVVVVDSVSALVPRTELEGDIGTPQIGAQARLMSHALRKLASNASKSGATIIFINQLRFKVGVLFGNPETTSGGNALKYYASIRLDIRSKDKIVEAGRPEPVGNKVKVKVVKNKVSPPFETAEFDIMYGTGISAAGCVFDVAKELGVLEARGSHYYYEGTKLAQGRDNVLTFLEDNPDTAARIATQTKAAMAERAAAGGGRAARRAAAASRSAALARGSFEDDDGEDEGGVAGASLLRLGGGGVAGGEDDDVGDELMDDEALLRELEERQQGGGGAGGSRSRRGSL